MERNEILRARTNVRKLERRLADHERTLEGYKRDGVHPELVFALRLRIADLRDTVKDAHMWLRVIAEAYTRRVDAA